jgi:hypothetical protein
MTIKLHTVPLVSADQRARDYRNSVRVLMVVAMVLGYMVVMYRT